MNSRYATWLHSIMSPTTYCGEFRVVVAATCQPFLGVDHTKRSRFSI